MLTKQKRKIIPVILIACCLAMICIASICGVSNNESTSIHALEDEYGYEELDNELTKENGIKFLIRQMRT